MPHAYEALQTAHNSNGDLYLRRGQIRPDRIFDRGCSSGLGYWV